MKSFILALLMFILVALAAPVQDLAGLSHVMPVLPSLAAASVPVPASDSNTTASLVRRGRDLGEYCNHSDEECDTKCCVKYVCMDFDPRTGHRWAADEEAFDHGRKVFGHMEPVWQNWEEYNAGEHRILFPDGTKQECDKERGYCYVRDETITQSDPMIPDGYGMRKRDEDSNGDVSFADNLWDIGA